MVRRVLAKLNCKHCTLPIIYSIKYLVKYIYIYQNKPTKKYLPPKYSDRVAEKSLRGDYNGSSPENLF